MDRVQSRSDGELCTVSEMTTSPLAVGVPGAFRLTSFAVLLTAQCGIDVASAYPCVTVICIVTRRATDVGCCGDGVRSFGRHQLVTLMRGAPLCVFAHSRTNCISRRGQRCVHCCG